MQAVLKNNTQEADPLVQIDLNVTIDSVCDQKSGKQESDFVLNGKELTNDWRQAGKEQKTVDDLVCGFD